MWYEPLLERGLVPDPIIRMGIRAQLRARLRQESEGSQEAVENRLARLIERHSSGPIAHHTGHANEQHYEVPPEFFAAVLGRAWKYSGGLWNGAGDRLSDSETRMLEAYLDRARVRDGQRILDLGCGWGSLSLFLARRLPGTRVLAVSNSGPQIETIRARARGMGLDNLEAVRADINQFAPEGRFDRVLSIEMFEHMHNFRELLRRIASWLAPEGLLFVHHFAHRRFAYPYVADNESEWMARHFFTGGVMPSADWLERFDEHMEVIERWDVDGTHYQRTCEAWLDNMSSYRAQVTEALARGYGSDQVTRYWHMWRIFFMACAELFGYGDGQEWFVAHRLLRPRAAKADMEPSTVDITGMDP
jgi:cyclopropane-fatty-acyl-phospholipid synthase